MPTNKKRTPRKRKDIIPLDESVKEFLLYGTAERGTPGYSLKCSRFFDDSRGDIEKAWTQHKEVLMAEWKKQKRPELPWAEELLELEII
jgi:hypothetical protein